jgi:hypothetical protein
LYNLPAVWCDYDAKAKQLVGKPALPPWALPGGTNGVKLPASGSELLTRLVRHEQKLVGEHRCLPGELVRHVLEAGKRAGYPADLEQWPVAAMQLAVDEAKRFADAHKSTSA